MLSRPIVHLLCKFAPEFPDPGGEIRPKPLKKENIIRTAYRFQLRRLWVRAGLAILASFALCCSISVAYSADLPTIVESVKPSVVGIGTVQQTRTPRAQLLGTGFAVGDGMHVLTNAHVVSRVLTVEDGEYLAVFVGQGVRPEIRKARKVAVDKEHDLALLRISGSPLPPLKLGASGGVREGEKCAFTGFPIGAVLGLYPATHHGIVSAITPIVTPKDRAMQLNANNIKRLRAPYNVFQLDATAYPGNSGSPLYEPDTGRVVAIVNMVFVKGTKESALERPSGITYAIPIDYAKAIMRKAGLSP